MAHQGRCNCGKVKFKTNGALRAVIACHCTQCRKQSGHYWAATNVLEKDLLIEGADNITWYQSSPGVRRGFCATCGSALFWKMQALDYISIGAGVFDAPSGLKLDSHIYCADKGDYYDINDGLPTYDKGRKDVVTAE